MIREMLGIAEGILQDLHNDHNEVATLINQIADSEDRSRRERLFEEMKAKLLAHAHAEKEVLYDRLKTSRTRPRGASRMRAPTSIKWSKRSFRRCRPATR